MCNNGLNRSQLTKAPSIRIRFCLKTDSFYPFSKNNPPPHVAFLNRFCHSTRKSNSDWKRHHLWWEHAHLQAREMVASIMCRVDWIQHRDVFPKSSFSSIYKSITELRFQNRHYTERFGKVFSDRFHWTRVSWTAKKKSPFSNKNGYVWTGPKYLNHFVLQQIVWCPLIKSLHIKRS